MVFTLNVNVNNENYEVLLGRCNKLKFILMNLTSEMV